MSEEEIIKELDKVINNNKDRVFMTGELNYVAMAESCKFKILDLQNQLQQKENIIKEVREDLDKQITFCTNEANGTTNDKYCRIAINYLKHLLEILKGEEQ